MRKVGVVVFGVAFFFPSSHELTRDVLGFVSCNFVDLFA